MVFATGAGGLVYDLESPSVQSGYTSLPWVVSFHNFIFHSWWTLESPGSSNVGLEGVHLSRYASLCGPN